MTDRGDAVSRGSKDSRNTGWEFDLVDPEKAERGDNGIMKNSIAQMGNYSTRHTALGMKVFLENRFPEMDYNIRAHPTLWTELDEPVVCGWCGFEEWYHPLVRWYFWDNDDGPFCSLECCARWAWEHDEVMPDG